MTISVPLRATSQIHLISCHTREQKGGNSEYNRIGADSAPAGLSCETADREDANDGLPKLRTRVRFPSPALGKHRRSNLNSAVLQSRLCLQRMVVVPRRAPSAQKGIRSQLLKLNTSASALRQRSVPFSITLLSPSRAKSWLVIPRLNNLSTKPIVEGTPGLNHQAMRASMHCHGELIEETSLTHDDRPCRLPRSQESNSSIPLCNHLGCGVEGSIQ
jgi:hypothetical protein